MALEIETNLRKMRTSLGDDGIAKYQLQLFDILEEKETLDVNALIGKEIKLQFEGDIHCIESGKRIKKTFGEGLSYDVWLKSPLASPSIVRPELSRIHEGIALRDFDWEQAHHNQPHILYLSRTSGVKVGVTRASNKFSRWIDQGATEGIVLAETPYRQLAGLIEVALKEYLPDKTAWQSMLKNELRLDESMLDYKNRMIDLLPSEFGDFISDDDQVTTINYPVLRYPMKVKSVKLDQPVTLEFKLSGIKGQYLLFDNDYVLNIRSHAGYRIKLSWN